MGKNLVMRTPRGVSTHIIDRSTTFLSNRWWSTVKSSLKYTGQLPRCDSIIVTMLGKAEVFRRSLTTQVKRSGKNDQGQQKDNIFRSGPAPNLIQTPPTPRIYLAMMRRRHTPPTNHESDDPTDRKVNGKIIEVTGAIEFEGRPCSLIDEDTIHHELRVSAVHLVTGARPKFVRIHPLDIQDYAV